MPNLVSVKKKYNSSFKTEYDIVNWGAYIKLTIAKSVLVLWGYSNNHGNLWDVLIAIRDYI